MQLLAIQYRPDTDAMQPLVKYLNIIQYFGYAMVLRSTGGAGVKCYIIISFESPSFKIVK